MQHDADKRLVAVDIGNSRIKLGIFPAVLQASTPEPTSTLELPARDWDEEVLQSWLNESLAAATTSGDGALWMIGSVFRAAAQHLTDWIAARRVDDVVRQLTWEDLPLSVALDEPQRVGIDRLLAAVATNHLRSRDRAAVIVDLGSAITVDLVARDGAFRGGAILPGIGMSARALCEFTDALPHLPMTELASPPAVLGRSTTAAMESGLFWGAVGGVREIASRLASESPHESPHIYLTGGAAPSVASLLEPDTLYCPHLVLAGIALCRSSEHRSSQGS